MSDVEATLAAMYRREAAEAPAGRVVHQSPPEWGHVTGCCGRYLSELGRPYVITDNATHVTCRGRT